MNYRGYRSYNNNNICVACCLGLSRGDNVCAPFPWSLLCAFRVTIVTDGSKDKSTGVGKADHDERVSDTFFHHCPYQKSCLYQLMNILINMMAVTMIGYLVCGLINC
ncbi:hypothetical protein LIER_41376 [Lithospermum erythrorhizon]|uniref:Uncharacterized protein n=1 Tax=Lithospermum erythrorhizon TaxID=34254 RepID=A0AAV3R9M9_LITER